MPDEDTTSNAPPGGESEEDIIGDLVAEHARQKDDDLASRQGKDDERNDAEHEVRAEPPKKPDDKARERPGKKEGDEGEAVHDESLSAKDLKSKLAKLVETDPEAAFLLAFGKKPEAFQINAGKLVAIRQHEQRERAKTRQGQSALLQQQHDFQGQVRAAVERLTPYEQYYDAEQAFRRTGDTGQIRKIVAGLLGAQNYSEANKRLLHDDKHSPAEMRMAQKLEQLERQIAERDQAVEREKGQRTVQEQRSADLAHIRKNLAGHEAAKLPRFEERVYRVLEKHFDPRVGLQITVEEAAERVVRGEKRRLERSPFYQAPLTASGDGKPRGGQGGAGNGNGSGNRAPLRRDSQNNGSRPAGDESDDDIVADIQAQIARTRIASRGKSA